MKLFLYTINVFSILGLVLAQTISQEQKSNSVQSTAPEQTTAPIEECQVYYSLLGKNDGSCCNNSFCTCNNGHITKM